MSDSTLFSLDFPHNPEDKRPLPEILAELAGFPLAYVDHTDGKRYYAVQDWIRGVAQPNNPRIFWSKMQKRLEAARIELYPPRVQLPYMANNGRTYQMDYGQAETLYQITQRMDANTGIRDKVLRFLAKAGVVVDEIRLDPDAAIDSLAERDPDKALDAVIRAYRRRGKDDRWINARLTGKIKREMFVNALKAAVSIVLGQNHYAQATNDVYRGLWQRTAAELRRQLDLTERDSLRDHQPTLALVYQQAAEEACAIKLGDRTELTWKQAREIVQYVAAIIGKQANETALLLGLDLATGKRLLPDGAQPTQ